MWNYHHQQQQRLEVNPRETADNCCDFIWIRMKIEKRSATSHARLIDWRNVKCKNTENVRFQVNFHGRQLFKDNGIHIHSLATTKMLNWPASQPRNQHLSLEPFSPLSTRAEHVIVDWLSFTFNRFFSFSIFHCVVPCVCTRELEWVASVCRSNCNRIKGNSFPKLKSNTCTRLSLLSWCVRRRVIVVVDVHFQTDHPHRRRENRARERERAI